jgi:hypothetical protein
MPETNEKLPTRRLPVRLPTRKLSEERPARRKRSKRKAKLKIPLGDTRGRGSDLVSADTSTTSAVQAGGSIKSADRPVTRLSQAGRSAALASNLQEVPAAPEQVPATLEGRSDAPEDVPAAPDEVTGEPEDVTARAVNAGQVADSSGDGRPNAASSDNENRSKDSVSTTSANTNTEQSAGRKEKHTMSTVPSERSPPPSGRALWHAAPEVYQMHEYITNVATVLHQAMKARDRKQIKSYRRTLTSAILRMREVVTRTVQAQLWDPSLVEEFMQDIDESAADLFRSANSTMMNLDQETLTAWADRCEEQARQVMHLAGQTHELITKNGWTLEECNEFMDELDEELEKLKNLSKQF